MADEKDKVVDEVTETDQSKTTSEEPKPEVTLESVAKIAKATQKGYTSTRQEISQIKEIVQSLVDTLSQKDTNGSSPYVTEQRLKEIILDVQTQQENAKHQANEYIETTLQTLREDGVIVKGEEDSLMKFALKIKEPNLEKAASIWREIKPVQKEIKDDVAKKQERQEVGSKVGTSSKSEGATEKKGVSYAQVRKMRDWFDF